MGIAGVDRFRQTSGPWPKRQQLNEPHMGLSVFQEHPCSGGFKEKKHSLLFFLGGGSLKKTDPYIGIYIWPLSLTWSNRAMFALLNWAKLGKCRDESFLALVPLALRVHPLTSSSKSEWLEVLGGRSKGWQSFPFSLLPATIQLAHCFCWSFPGTASRANGFAPHPPV